jgi:hypothetical protein
MDLLTINGKTIDRGGNINLITPSPTEKYKVGDEIKIPEMIVTGYLVDIKKVDINELLASAIKSPELVIEQGKGKG